MSKSVTVPCDCCVILGSMIIFYSYDTDSSLGKGAGECPDVGEPCGGAENPSCAGDTVSGFLYSDPWPSVPLGKVAKAKIYAGACMDNSGNIGTASDYPEDPCALAYTPNDVIDTVQVGQDKRMRIPFSVTNSSAGGPYGICGATIEWYWE